MLIIYFINNIPYTEVKDFTLFDSDKKGDFDSNLSYFLQRDYFLGEKLDDVKKQDMIFIAKNYFSELSPIVLSEGKKLYFEYIADDVFVNFDIKLFSADGTILDYYEHRESEITYKLIEFIVANNLLSKWCEKFCIRVNFPINIGDVFDSINPENISAIMNLIKTMERQVFIWIDGNNKQLKFL